MRTIEQIIEGIRAGAGADFAFVLSRKGRLVTTRAPRDMPEEGRLRLLRAARPLLSGAGDDAARSTIVTITLPREDLVPYGGAAPIDIFLGVVAAQAIVCAVMASWGDQSRAAPALQSGLAELEPILRRGAPSTGRGRDVAPVKGTPYRSPSLVDRADPDAGFPKPVRMSFLTEPTATLAKALPKPERPRVTSLPEIQVGEAELGRLSRVAIRHEMPTDLGSSPEITYGETDLGRASLVAIGRERVSAGSAPEITITGEAALGRATLVAIDIDGRDSSEPSVSADAPEPAESPEAPQRKTLTWGATDRPAATAPRGAKP